jgi:hypothetical protein
MCYPHKPASVGIGRRLSLERICGRESILDRERQDAANGGDKRKAAKPFSNPAAFISQIILVCEARLTSSPCPALDEYIKHPSLWRASYSRIIFRVKKIQDREKSLKLFQKAGLQLPGLGTASSSRCSLLPRSCPRQRRSARCAGIIVDARTLQFYTLPCLAIALALSVKVALSGLFSGDDL